jgi:hypothetical protein
MSLEDDEAIILNPENHQIWWPWFQTRLYKHGGAGEEVRNEEEELTGDPDINERFEALDGTFHYRFDHNTGDEKISAKGLI